MHATALIAEDEPLLGQALRQELARCWPELEVLALVGDGDAAVAEALQRRPQIVFLDIRMPGLDGLQAAQALSEDWPDDGPPLPLIVFVTAYDQHAVAAFEQAAIDYVLKPAQPERLQRTCERLQAALSRQAAVAAAASASVSVSARPQGSGEAEALMRQLHALLAHSAAHSGHADRATPAATEPPLTVLQASVGSTIHLVPVAEVLCLEAADKYVRVLTASAEHLLRTSLKELMPRLPPGVFWQVHRGTLVRAEAIRTVRREDNGRCTLSLQGRAEPVGVSRLYAHLFKGM
ncbi:LytTR family DNA-binding domain-containing protein [Aquabacterium sp.]|uniref:LytR/AlgR family response regulator transcription factor n=1 Tax=Aquabacterium sp. TaxID=1872578 RepID=UPI0025B84D38|nr:LytTR family DNA-binding domain-containing protein [Aquabacterium sp.]